MRTSDFDYQLASELIAQTPAEPRDHSRLMVIHRDDGSIEHRQFFEITEFLRTGDVMVLNDSRVIPARLMGRRQSGGKTEVLLLRRLEAGLWEALVRPSKRIKAGERIELFGMRQKPEAIPATIEVLERSEQGLRTVRLDNEAILEELGEIPLPPYIHDYSGDPERYQTVYARENGSVAAPTAGLNFTPQLLPPVQEKGIEIAFFTPPVGLAL